MDQQDKINNQDGDKHQNSQSGEKQSNERQPHEQGRPRRRRRSRSAYSSDDRQQNMQQNNTQQQGLKSYFSRFRKSSKGVDNPWDLLEKVLTKSIIEQRRSRRWGIFFKSLIFVYLFALLFYMPLDNFLGGKSPTQLSEVTEPHVGVVNIQGVIAQDFEANADVIIGALKRAMENEQAKAVILSINSPGGSPVHAGRVYDAILKFKKDYTKPVYAVVDDIGASGAYYIAAGADEIYAYSTSLVGSIGVISAGFGLDKAIEKLGIERRVTTAGKHKDFLDPFAPLNQSNQVFWQDVLDGVYQVFVDSVKQTRGDKIKSADYDQVFSGLVFNGNQALKLGLIDGLGTVSSVSEEAFNLTTLVDYSHKEGIFDRFTEQLGLSFYERFVTRLSQVNLF